ncbi:MAG: pantetheine-phosphate adenylyltransferase [Prevotellaceae bacterium]|jgi:pantetheine-phosphate adenylyltransferase|nr:pantetheine-phosphate adenylyltransferase [Prevotellaceae bacterium]
MKTTAVFPGSFDPFTLGHQAIVEKALLLFDELAIAVGVNAGKQSLFTVDERVQSIKDVFKGDARVRVEPYEGLTVDYCKKAGATHMVRGLRTVADFEQERLMAQANKLMLPSVETVFLLASPEQTFISSTVVRDVLKSGGDASNFLPEIKP